MLSTFLDDCLELEYFEGTEAPIPYFRVDGESRLVVVVGDNASGKSFFRRVVSGFCRQDKREIMNLSMQGRRQVAYNVGLTFVYGDEETQSTGVNSTSTVISGISTCRGRDHDHMIFWDEPDIGLSDGYAAGIGQKLCDFAMTMPSHTAAAFVVTHSKALVSQLFPCKPHYLHLGSPPAEAPQSLQAWHDQSYVVRDPSELAKRSHERFGAIQKILNNRKSRE